MTRYLLAIPGGLLEFAATRLAESFYVRAGGLREDLCRPRVIMKALPGSLAGLLAFLLAAPCLAETLFVSGQREVMMRTGPTTGHKIIGVLKTGDAMELQREDGDYYVVKLSNGRRGYVLKTFLTREAPPQRRLVELEKRVQEQEQELKRLRSENARLVADSKKIRTDAASQTQLLHRLQQERADVTRDNRITWFMAGAGVLLVGWIMGWTRLRLRRKTRRQGLGL